MNRTRASLAGLIVTAAALLAPTAASADPWFTAEVDNAELQAGESHEIGMPVRITGSGCDNTSGTAQMGEFVSAVGDPWSLTAEEQIQLEFAVDDQGGFVWETSIPLDNPTGTFHARWYCSTSPVTSLHDPAVTWVAPLSWMTITEPTVPLMARSTARASASATTFRLAARTIASAPAEAPAAYDVAFEVDPDALPAVDKVAINGASAAKLKAKVDARLSREQAFRTALAKLLRGMPKVAAQLNAPATDADYVRAAHAELTGRAPSAKALAAGVARLEDGGLKVQVVEDIALTAHDATWWNKRA